MTISSFASPTRRSRVLSAEYEPGVCNIGPEEIARRRMVGHIGLVLALGMLAAMIAVNAPTIARLVIVLPAAASASGYLQAWLKFCAGFGSRGIVNFGKLGESEEVGDAYARARDRRRARQIGLWALGIGILAGVGAVLLP